MCLWHSVWYVWAVRGERVPDCSGPVALQVTDSRDASCLALIHAREMHSATVLPAATCVQCRSAVRSCASSRMASRLASSYASAVLTSCSPWRTLWWRPGSVRTSSRSTEPKAAQAPRPPSSQTPLVRCCWLRCTASQSQRSLPPARHQRSSWTLDHAQEKLRVCACPALVAACVLRGCAAAPSIYLFVLDLQSLVGASFGNACVFKARASPAPTSDAL